MSVQNTEITRLNSDLRGKSLSVRIIRLRLSHLGFKQKYLELKKKEQRGAATQLPGKPTRTIEGPKFAGGGFNLKSYKIA